MKRLATVTAAAAATLVSFAVAAQGQGPATQTVTPPSKLTICHKTGRDANPWNRITVSSRAMTNPKSTSGRLLRAHMRHTGDAVVVGTAACPSPTLTPAPTATPATKITICHKTGSTTNPYRRITISSRAVTNANSSSGKTLRGHMSHTGDLLMPGAAACPSGTQNDQGAKLTAALRPVQGATGSGNATFTIRLGQSTLCYTLTVTGVAGVTDAHIHRGSTGAIVVPLTVPTTGRSSGCTTVARPLLLEILQNPAAFYVNVHTMTHPNGQAQGTLSR